MRALLSGQKRRILLNLADVPYVDSSGIGALVEAVVLTATEGGRVKLAAPAYGFQRSHPPQTHPAFQIYPGEAERWQASRKRRGAAASPQQG